MGFSMSSYIEYNGVSSERFSIGKDISLLLIQLDDGDMTENFGGQYSMLEDASAFNGGILLNYGRKVSPIEFQLKFTVVKNYRDKNNKVYHYEPIPLDTELRKEISKYLFTGNYGQLCFDKDDDLVYLASFTSGGERNITFGDYGYITVNCHLAYPHASTRNLVENYTNYNLIKTITIDNLSNTRGYTYPYIWIKTLENETSIKITNIHTGEQTSFNNLKPDTIIEMWSDTKQIRVSNSDYIYGKKDNFNRKFLRLINGSVNQLRVEGKCRISVQTNYEILH